ncbi:hypothetical protein [Sodalis sp. (in: enterobacteria)]|uniref:hypothetical protein n=1 Tax=Sodalis sp. (in: enterobacteria) TaxID=1898979 RepID=UPI003F6887C4
MCAHGKPPPAVKAGFVGCVADWPLTASAIADAAVGFVAAVAVETEISAVERDCPYDFAIVAPPDLVEPPAVAASASGAANNISESSQPSITGYVFIMLSCQDSLAYFTP